LDANILDGQVAVVTGGSRGIGREVAHSLAMAGAKVVVTARNAKMLDETVAIIRNAGGDCTAQVMDVTDNKSILQAVEAITAQYGQIDLLVNNAGVGSILGALPWDVDVDDWWHIQEVNVKGVFMCSKAVLPSMIERGQGRIINMGSYAAIHASPRSSAYSVSKAALMRLTDSMAVAAKDTGVAVFVISPGLVLTDMTKDVPSFKTLPESAWTPVEQVGELCIALASGKADMLSGCFIHTKDDDLDDMISRADEIMENDLYTLQLKR